MGTNKSAFETCEYARVGSSGLSSIWLAFLPPYWLSFSDSEEREEYILVKSATNICENV
jgi:hypothetical protein